MITSATWNTKAYVTCITVQYIDYYNSITNTTRF